MREHDLARNLRRLRAEQGMTLAELALASKVPKATLALFEAGSAEPDPAVLRDLAAVFGVPLGALVGHPAGGAA